MADIFTGKQVETVGLFIAALGSIFALHGGPRIGAVTCLGVYLVSRFFPSLFKWLEFFADVPAWPNYVSLVLCGIFAAYAGGWPAVLVLCGLGAAGDGRMFDALY